MNSLSAKEQDLLQRIQDKQELIPLFFRKAKGLKWFYPLQELGFFDSGDLSGPVPSGEEGYVRIHKWQIIDYLLSTVDELEQTETDEYSIAFLHIIEETTNHAKDHGIENYHAWWQFSKLLSKIPLAHIEPKHIQLIEYWLADRFNTSLVVDQLGGKWLPALLDKGDEHSLLLAQNLLVVLYRVRFCDQERVGREKRERQLNFDFYHGEKFTRKIAYAVGEKLGRNGLAVFDEQLKVILTTLQNDKWSSIWQPAIEDHDQNKHRKNPENILVIGYRDALDGFMESSEEESLLFISEMMGSELETINRLVINALRKNYERFKGIANQIVVDKYFSSNFRHEMWHFLSENYTKFDQEMQEEVLNIIGSIEVVNEDNSILRGGTAYSQATWLSAIKNAGVKESEAYEEAIQTAKAEPDHPDFSSYMSSGWGGSKSPYSIEELQSLSPSELVKTLAEYESGDGWREPSIGGLTRTLKQRIKNEPLSIYPTLGEFLNLDLAYTYVIIEAFSELWTEKSGLPWEEVWPVLLEFINNLIEQPEFWSEANTNERENFVANRYWIVGSVGRLIEAGAKSDEHAFPEIVHQDAKHVLDILLNRETGETFAYDSDAVSIAINSPRGRCLEALINVTLRECRLSDKGGEGHVDTWNEYVPYYDAELDRANQSEYEFATLVTNYLPNFLYMSKDWVINNLERIFDQGNYQKWLCAMQGYSYVGNVFEEIFCFLKVHGDFLKAFDDENIQKKVGDRFVQQIVISYLNDFELYEDEGSLIQTLVKRNRPEELHQLIWFVWTLRKRGDEKLSEKVYELWPKLSKLIDVETRSGKKLASDLCHWVAYIEHIDEERMNWLAFIAPYADESHNSYIFFENLARLSEGQPFEANDLWNKLIERSSPDYPEESIRKIIQNLVRNGPEGIRAARNTVSEYLKYGNERPTQWLREVLDAAE
jgi:hypothetical protein